MRIDIERSTPVPHDSPRLRQISAMFDCPLTDVSRMKWSFDFPYEESDWNVGLITGPSGSGKSTVLTEVFGRMTAVEWTDRPVFEGFPSTISVVDVAAVCQAVGFNTIPAWFRPFNALSNGEQFRVTLAHALISNRDVIIMDEFTSVVDRQVGRFASHAAQKYVRKKNLKFVAATCHDDLEDWLQPDWVLEPATGLFRRRSVRRRPSIECRVQRVKHSEWDRFAPFHYLTNSLHRAATCFGLFVENQKTPVAFGGVLQRPTKLGRGRVFGLSRLVCLPDWQGMGLGLALSDALGAIYTALGFAFVTYPAHPSLIRSYDRSPHYTMTKRPDRRVPFGKTSKLHHEQARPCATFRYVGPTIDKTTAEEVIGAT